MRSAFLTFAMMLPLMAQSPDSSPSVRQTAHGGPFDPTRDVQKDFAAAQAQARQSGKRILLDVGGNWCSWCRLMHAFFEAQPSLRALRDQHFVTLLVNYSPDNKNEAFLGKYPKCKGYPHFFVVEADGTLVHSQDTGDLEEGKGYSPEKMAAFFKAWAPKRP